MLKISNKIGKIGVFDSGFGGLTILKGIVKKMPQYDYIYLGDNARVPYGSRSPQTTYEFTKQAINYLMKRGCALVIIACNTASALALRKLQKEWLPQNFPKNRVLGVIRPTAEAIINLNIKKIGILATESAIKSNAFKKEIHKLNPAMQVFEQAAPLLVPIIEAGEQSWRGTDLIITKYLNPLFRQKIDALILGCTHYPLIKNKIKKIVKTFTTIKKFFNCSKKYNQKCNIKIISQDEIIPDKLADYLNRHPEIEKRLSKKHKIEYLTTDLSPRSKFLGKLFLGKTIKPKLVNF